MNFLCTCCKKRITKEQKIPEFLAGTIMYSKAYHMEWAVFDAEEMSRPIQERKWSNATFSRRSVTSGFSA